MNLKNLLKTLKLNESTISMLLGAVIIVIVGILVVNYFKKPDTGITIPGTETEVTETQPAIKGATHTVAKGETLWSIAEDAYGSGYNWVDIAKENSLTNPNQIDEGVKLDIPNVTSKTQTVFKDVEKKITSNQYVVQKGDSLWNIAVRAYGDGYKWIDIAEKNSLTNPNIIHPGNSLVIPR